MQDHDTWLVQADRLPLHELIEDELLLACRWRAAKNPTARRTGATENGSPCK